MCKDITKKEKSVLCLQVLGIDKYLINCYII